MKKRGLLIGIPICLLAISSCSFVKGMEHHLTVVFEYKDEIVKTSDVSEFNNGVCPTLDDALIPTGCRFYGWTWKDPDSIDITKYTDSKNKVTDEFYTNFIEYDDVVHYDEIKDYAFNSTVTLKPLFIDESIIPIPTYYLAIGWYAKSSTSGLTQEIVDKWTIDLKNYLKTEGASDSDLEDVVITGYEGDVATAGSLINKDKYNDILIGFGNNIDSTGGVSVINKVGGIQMGTKSNRYIAQLNEKDLTVKVFSWLQTSEGQASLK